MLSFLQALIEQSFSVYSAPKLEDRDGEQNKSPPFRRRARVLLHHLDFHKSLGPGDIYLRVLRELAEMLTKPLFIFIGSPGQMSTR